jgi:hypothetical protein
MGFEGGEEEGFNQNRRDERGVPAGVDSVSETARD